MRRLCVKRAPTYTPAPSSFHNSFHLQPAIISVEPSAMGCAASKDADRAQAASSPPPAHACHAPPAASGAHPVPSDPEAPPLSPELAKIAAEELLRFDAMKKEALEGWGPARDAALAALPEGKGSGTSLALPRPPLDATLSSRLLRGEATAADVASIRRLTRSSIWLFSSSTFKASVECQYIRPRPLPVFPFPCCTPLSLSPPPPLPLFLSVLS